MVMAVMKNPDSVLLVPVHGKYAKIRTSGSTVEVWRVNPATNSSGTKVPYDIAMSILTLSPPVVTLAPVIEDGRYVAQLTDDDMKKVQAARVSASGGNLVTHVSYPVNKTSGSGTDAAVLAKQADALRVATETIQKQAALLSAQATDMAELKKTVAALAKSQPAGSSS
jgi:hypothetical protein